MIDVREFLKNRSVEELNRSADAYFSEITEPRCRAWNFAVE